MYDQLPSAIKQRVLCYLKANDFPAAKEVYDTWLAEEQLKWSSSATSQAVI